MVNITIQPSWSPEEIRKKSNGSRVRWRDQAKIPDRTMKVIVDTLTWGSKATNKYWDDRRDHILKRAVEFKDAEQEKRMKTIPQCVNKVKKGKRIFLMKEFLTQFQYPDLGGANPMREGFPMMGLPGTNGVFGKKHPEDVTHGADPKWLDHMAKPMREELLESLQTTTASPLVGLLVPAWKGSPDRRVRAGVLAISRGWTARSWSQGFQRRQLEASSPRCLC